METGTAHMFSQEDFAADEFISLRFDVTFFCDAQKPWLQQPHWPSVTPLWRCACTVFFAVACAGPTMAPKRKASDSAKPAKKSQGRIWKPMFFYVVYLMCCNYFTFHSELVFVPCCNISCSPFLILQSFPSLTTSNLSCFLLYVCAERHPRAKARARELVKENLKLQEVQVLLWSQSPRHSWCLFRRCRKSNKWTPCKICLQQPKSAKDVGNDSAKEPTSELY